MRVCLQFSRSMNCCRCKINKSKRKREKERTAGRKKLHHFFLHFKKFVSEEMNDRPSFRLCICNISLAVTYARTNAAGPHFPLLIEVYGWFSRAGLDQPPWDFLKCVSTNSQLRAFSFANIISTGVYR